MSQETQFDPKRIMAAKIAIKRFINQSSHWDSKRCACNGTGELKFRHLVLPCRYNSSHKPKVALKSQILSIIIEISGR